MRYERMKKIFLIVLTILLIAGLSLSLFSCKTSALWRGQGNDTRDNNADVAEGNGSEKYIVYAALNSSGNLITRPQSGDPEATAEYAVVGYTGLVAELMIPSQYNGKNVTKVLVATPYDNYYCYRDVAANGAPIDYTGDDARLANNTVITSMVLGSNVSFVGAGVCVGMTNLTTLSFKRASSVTVGANAFAACSALRTVSFACASADATLNGNFSGLTITYAS